MGKRVAVEMPGREIGIRVTDLSRVFLYILTSAGQPDYISVALDSEQARNLGRMLLEQADVTDEVNGKEPHPHG
jgi:hypothetical protein